MASSRKFIWVKVDRDAAPEVPRRFGVSAYPTLLTLGDDLEKVHRFSGFKKPDVFRKMLEAALERHALYRAGEEWDVPDARPAAICDAGTVETFPAPSEEVPSGLAVHGGAVFVAQGGRLFRLDAAAKVAAAFDLPAGVRDLCSDGERLYGMEYGWTAGKPIHVLDPATGKTLRAIVTEANRKNRSMGAAGIAWQDGRLWVLAGMRGTISAVDPATGLVTGVLQTDRRWLAGLAFDGTHFVAGGREALYWFDPKTGQTVREQKIHYPVRALAVRDGRLLLMEQPVFGHDKEHKRIRVWPKTTVVHELRLP